MKNEAEKSKNEADGQRNQLTIARVELEKAMADAQNIDPEAKRVQAMMDYYLEAASFDRDNILRYSDATRPITGAFLDVIDSHRDMLASYMTSDTSDENGNVQKSYNSAEYMLEHLTEKVFAVIRDALQAFPVTDTPLPEYSAENSLAEHLFLQVTIVPSQ